MTLIGLPFVINWIANNVLITSQAKFESWLGFMGSYIGGIISGVITLVGVLVAFQLEKNKNLAYRYRAAASDIEILSEELERVVGEATIVYDFIKKDKKKGEGSSTIADSWFNQKLKTYEDYKKLCLSIDSQLGNEMLGFYEHLFNLSMENGMIFQKDESISNSGFRNFDDDLKGLRESCLKIQNRISVLKKVTKKHQ